MFYQDLHNIPASSSPLAEAANLLFEIMFHYAKNIKIMEVVVFTITEKAAERAQFFMTQEGKQGWGMRIFQAGESCCGPSYGIDLIEKPVVGDDVVEKDGLKVFLSADCSDAFADMQLDYYEEGDSAGFVLNGGKEPSCGDCSSCG
jgi:iron-sulfur cluster assembly accessory protein